MSSSLQPKAWRWERPSQEKRVLQPRLKLSFQEDVFACSESLGLLCRSVR